MRIALAGVFAVGVLGSGAAPALPGTTQQLCIEITDQEATITWGAFGRDTVALCLMIADDGEGSISGIVARQASRGEDVVLKRAAGNAGETPFFVHAIRQDPGSVLRRIWFVRNGETLVFEACDGRTCDFAVRLSRFTGTTRVSQDECTAVRAAEAETDCDSATFVDGFARVVEETDTDALPSGLFTTRSKSARLVQVRAVPGSIEAGL